MKTPATLRPLFATIGFVAILIFSGCYRDNRYNPPPDTTPASSGYAYFFNDDFNSNQHNWAFDDNANDAHVSIRNGQLKYTYYPLNPGTNTVAISTGARLTGNFSIQTSLQTNNAMGLVFGVSPQEYGYSFFIDNAGHFAIYDEGNATIAAAVIQDWTASAALSRAGFNKLELEQYNGTWTGYANGSRLFSIPAKTLYGEQVGFIVLDGTTGYADYLTVDY